MPLLLATCNLYKISLPGAERIIKMFYCEKIPIYTYAGT